MKFEEFIRLLTFLRIKTFAIRFEHGNVVFYASRGWRSIKRRVGTAQLLQAKTDICSLTVGELLRELIGDKDGVIIPGCIYTIAYDRFPWEKRS